MFEFHLRATPHDREGYYFPRWDKATPITVRAATRQEAINQAAAALGACPRGRGWFWGFKVVRIESVTAEATS
jgi:hypothetical protein